VGTEPARTIAAAGRSIRWQVIGTRQGEQAHEPGSSQAYRARCPREASLHRKARQLQAPPPCPGGARKSATLGFLRKLLGWTYRPDDGRLLDNFSDHMLRDIGIKPDGRDESNVGFWRRR